MRDTFDMWDEIEDKTRGMRKDVRESATPLIMRAVFFQIKKR